MVKFKNITPFKYFFLQEKNSKHGEYPVKTFLFSLILYVLLIASSFILVLPSCPSDLPVIILVIAVLFFSFNRMIIPKKKDGTAFDKISLKRKLFIIVFHLMILTGTFITLYFSSTPLGPFLLAVSVLFYLFLILTKRRLSIFAGLIIYALLIFSAYILFQWNAGLLSIKKNPFAVPLFFLFCGVIHTTSIRGIAPYERRNFWDSVFPIRSGLKMFGIALLSGVLLLINILFIIGPLRQPHLRMLEAKHDDLTAILNGVRIKEKKLPSVQNELQKAELQFGAAQTLFDPEYNEGWINSFRDYAKTKGLTIVDDSYYHWKKTDFYGSVFYLIKIRGERTRILEFIKENIKGPGLRRLINFRLHVLEDGMAECNIKWTGYTFIMSSRSKN